MPTFLVSARKTSPLTPLTVDAPTREEAIMQVVKTTQVGESIEVLSAVEQPSDDAGGVTGATGSTGTR